MTSSPDARVISMVLRMDSRVSVDLDPGMLKWLLMEVMMSDFGNGHGEGVPQNSLTMSDISKVLEWIISWRSRRYP